MIKTALVTGSASGIGLHLTDCFVKKGWNTVATDRDIESLERIAVERNWPKDRILLQALDVSKEDDWNSCVKNTVEKFSQIDVLINCAGMMQPGFILDADIKALRISLEVNVTGQVIGAKTVGKQMVSQGSGHIVQIASLAALGPLQGVSSYAASKAAVRSMMLALAMELEETGVSVTVLCPDLVKTAMFDLQLKYPKESAMVFSGAKPLAVEDISEALFSRILTKKPLELYLPYSRGFVSRLGGFLPWASQKMQRYYKSKGEDKINSISEK